MGRLLSSLLVLLFYLPLYAQPHEAEPFAADYPTLAALDAAILPPRDRNDLAVRLRGVTDMPALPTNPPLRQLGEQQTFFVTNSSEGSTFPITATLRAIGDHIYLWVEDGAALTDEGLATLATAFDERVYPNVRGLWGAEASPGVDGDPRIYGLFAFNLGSSAAAYFSSDHTYPSATVPTSNAHEMFFFNLDVLGSDDVLPMIESTLAHEFQHMIRNHQHRSLDLWLNEGLSQFTQVYLYGDLGVSALAFLNIPDTQLNTWSEAASGRIYHYGASAMFLVYLYERYGLEAVQALSADTSPRALDALDNVLSALGEPGAEEFFADWVMANALLNASDEDGRFGYGGLSASFPPAAVEQTVSGFPFEYSGSVSQYAADYVRLTNLGDGQTLNIQVDAPAEVELIPSDDANGHFWYSNRGDVSDTRLTRAFDLTNATSATLNYRLWYHTEQSWDYGYIMVSENDGVTWHILETAHTTTDNPHGAAYGAGYNGVSGGGAAPVWVEESVSLEAYVGQNVLVRFEMITDDGVNQPGMAIDDVSIPELGYVSDFETDDGGWQAEGWVLTDNRLPQTLWVQVAQQNGDDVSVTRWLTQGGGSWQVEHEAGAQGAVVALSPLAPVTTIPMPYTLTISVSD